jgi:hypothetical protein
MQHHNSEQNPQEMDAFPTLFCSTTTYMVIQYTGITQENTYYDWYIFNLDQLVTTTTNI